MCLVVTAPVQPEPPVPAMLQRHKAATRFAMVIEPFIYTSSDQSDDSDHV